MYTNRLHKLLYTNTQAGRATNLVSETLSLFKYSTDSCRRSISSPTPSPAHTNPFRFHPFANPMDCHGVYSK